MPLASFTLTICAGNQPNALSRARTGALTYIAMPRFRMPDRESRVSSRVTDPKIRERHVRRREAQNKVQCRLRTVCGQVAMLHPCGPDFLLVYLLLGRALFDCLEVDSAPNRPPCIQSAYNRSNKGGLSGGRSGAHIHSHISCTRISLNQKNNDPQKSRPRANETSSSRSSSLSLGSM